MRPITLALLAVLTLCLPDAATVGFSADKPAEKPDSKQAEKPDAKPFSSDGNRLAYLDEINPYYPHRNFAKLTTPQWISPEERKAGVEAVIILSIDDMRDPVRYENYLRPILDRLKKVKNTAGMAPLSIFTNVIDVKHPQLQTWLKEGLSFEVHTIAHPCPCLGKFKLEQAKQTYHECVDLLHQIPNYKGPVAFRMPCCDSMNSVSPRFFAEVMNGVSKKGHFLQIDSSVFNLFTANDPDLPRDLVLDADGTERFRKYIPKGKGFVNFIEDYPYPYTIGNRIWQFPSVIPSDWEAQHLQGVNNPRTVEDLKAAIDCTVVKQGVFTFVFHPHGWIKAEQVVELIDHAEKKHGGKVKFMSFADADERLNQHLLNQQPLRDKTEKNTRTRPVIDDIDSQANAVRVLDVNNDGYMDVVASVDGKHAMRIWDPHKNSWMAGTLPIPLQKARFGVFMNGNTAMAELSNDRSEERANKHIHLFQEQGWKPWHPMPDAVLRPKKEDDRIFGNYYLTTRSVRLRDIDSDGQSEVIVTGGSAHRRAYLTSRILKLGNKDEPWKLETGLPIHLPRDRFRFDAVRWVDLNGDGFEDVVFFNAEYYVVAVRENTPLKVGDRRRPLPDWQLLHRERNDVRPSRRLPHPIQNKDGTNNGCFVKGRALYWQNEGTGNLPGNVFKVTFDELLAAGREQDKQDAKQPDTGKKGASKYPPSPQPNPMSPQLSMRAMEVRPGFKVELVAAEPLVMDPVAYDWGPDGKLWVVEMGDYPMGVDADKRPGAIGKPGGRVVYLTDTDGDGKYDKRTLFLDGLKFPTGIMAWDKGVLVTMAPQIFYAEDTTPDNDDHKADHRETLFTGFSEGNQQHRVNGLRLGLDNWIHVGNGDSGGKAVLVQRRRTATLPWDNEKDPTKLRPLWQKYEADIRGRDLRIRPHYWYGSMSYPSEIRLKGQPRIDDKQTPWYVDATAGQTQFGRERDDWGNWFGSNNPNPGWQYIYPDHYLRRNPHFNAPASQVMLTNDKNVYAISRVYSPSISNHNVKPGQANPHTSANSLIIYRDDYYGPHFAPTYDTQNAFISEPVHNLVRRHVLKRNGVRYEASRAAGEETREFLASRDVWFRPAMLRVGPDGCLWIADVYRHVIEHPKWIQDDWEATLDLRAGADKGRIYRVVRVDERAKPQAAPRLDGLSQKDLVAALDSANGWQRDMAHKMLLWDSTPWQSEKFYEIYKAMDATQRPEGFSIDDLNDEDQFNRRTQLNTAIQNTPLLQGLSFLILNAKRPQTRLQALCVLDGFFAVTPDLLARALNDEHPAVRRHAVRLCERLIKPDNLINVRMPLYRNVIKALTDRAMDKDPAVRMQLAFTLGEWEDERAGKALAGLIKGYGNDMDLRTAAISSMLPHVDITLTAMFRFDDAHAHEFIQQAFKPWIEQARKDPTRLKQLLDRMLGDGRGKFATWQYQAMVMLAEEFGGKLPHPPRGKAAYVLLKTETLFDAADEKATETHRVAAMEAASYFADARDVADTATKLLDNPRTPATVQQAAAIALLRDRSLQGVLPAESVISQTGVQALFKRWNHLSPAVRQSVLGALLSRNAGIGAVLGAVEKGTIARTALSLSQREQLTQHKDKAIAARAVKLLGGPPEAQRGKVIEQYKQALSLKGDATRGRTLFEKNCATCHHLAGLGRHVGPDLRLLKNGSPAALLAAILDPNQAVESKYLNYIIDTADGDTLTGIITNESGNGLTLISADGIPRELLRKDVVALRSGTKSLMPEGLEEAMKPQDVADVIAFIGSAGPPPKQFANNQPRTIHADKDGVLALPASAAAVFGPSIVFEQKYRNLGWWSHHDDRAVWTIEVAKAGTFVVTLDWALANAVASNQFQLVVGSAKLEGPVPSTGSWDRYQSKSFGKVSLPAGSHRLMFRSKGPVSGALIDLRTVTLSPAR